jgi:hypothetical protein
MKSLPFFAVILGIPLSIGYAFEWTDTEGKYLDLKHDDRPIARYIYEPIDESSLERREATYKPFCHIYDRYLKDQFITKGPGGKFTHHRGIFYGFSQISYTDRNGEKHEKIDTWHCRRGHLVHREFLEQSADSKSASFTSLIDWIGDDGKSFAEEKRSMTFTMSGVDIIVDFKSILTPTVPEMHVDGDPQHAGFQFRAHNDVNDKHKSATYYIRPETGIAEMGETINWSAKLDNKTTRNLPWKAMSYIVHNKRYTVCYLDHSKNPKPARYSERDYGRFGSYFAADLVPKEPLTVRYRLVIRQGEMKAEEVAKHSEIFLSDQ